MAEIEALRDDMTMIEAQAEAERRWPGAKLTEEGNFRTDHPPSFVRLYKLSIPFPDGVGATVFFSSWPPVGCIDQAIAAEARRTSPRDYFRQQLLELFNYAHDHEDDPAVVAAIRGPWAGHTKDLLLGLGLQWSHDTNHYVFKDDE